jgi:23S rRNA (adenine2030-N6)-methyltransferase
MNYRHAYHAGNFADVLKHAVLALVIEHLKLKSAPFRIIDTHSGIGLYDLAGTEAEKTGEWREGIGRVLAATLSPPAGAALAPYLDVVRAVNASLSGATENSATLRRYPGSPLIARHLMRDDDRLILNELHPDDNASLESEFARDAQTKILQIDGFTALKSLLPPKERRGVVLVDPAYEEPGELDRLVQGLKDASRRFAGGTIMLWYPIKDTRAIAAFRRRIAELGLDKVLVVELMIRSGDDPSLLNGCGLIVVNPPFTLEEKLKALLPELAGVLAQDKGAGFRLEAL